MAEKDANTKSAKEKAPKELKWGPGPDTVDKVQDKLGTIIAFAFLGKRAFMDGNYSPERWKQYLREIDSPYGDDFEGLTEMAFEGLLKMACQAWMELCDPEDAIEGPVIQRQTPPSPRRRNRGSKKRINHQTGATGASLVAP